MHLKLQLKLAGDHLHKSDNDVLLNKMLSLPCVYYQGERASNVCRHLFLFLSIWSRPFSLCSMLCRHIHPNSKFSRPPPHTHTRNVWTPCWISTLSNIMLITSQSCFACQETSPVLSKGHVFDLSWCYRKTWRVGHFLHPEPVVRKV